MRGFKTDQNGRWSPVHRLYDEDDGVPMVMVAVMAAILFVVVFAQWWFV